VAPDKEDEVVPSDITHEEGSSSSLLEYVTIYSMVTLDDEGQIYGLPPPGTAGFESPTACNPKGHPLVRASSPMCHRRPMLRERRRQGVTVSLP
jgi:hypothetical protein